MEKILTIVVVALVLSTSAILVSTANAVAVRRETAVQYTETGKDYKHGEWCIDGRVF